MPGGAAAGVLRGHEDHVFAAAFSPDGQMLATGSRDGTLRLWDVAGRRELARYVAEEPWVYAIAFAPDGASLLYSGMRLHRLTFPKLEAPGPWLTRVLAQTGLVMEGTEMRRPALQALSGRSPQGQ
jgi:WD40 repeat protein